MNKYPRSIRYALSTYSNNLRRQRNSTDSQRFYSQGNFFSNSITDNNSKLNENTNQYNKNSSPYNNFNYHTNLNSYHFRDNNKDDIDEIKNKTEARLLIEQTKKMMEEYSLNKLKKMNKINDYKTLNTQSNKKFISKSITYHHKNFKNKSASNLDNIQLNFFNENNLENYPNKSTILNKDRLDQLASKPSSIDTLTQKIIYKNKEIKVLERELKEKNSQIKTLQDKLSAKNDEIKKLLENLDNERSNSLKVENSKLNKKIFNLEKSNNDMKKICDKNIEELNTKLMDLNNILEGYKIRNKELENKNLILRQDNEKLRDLLEEKENLNMVLREKNDIEKKSNEVNNIEINNLRMNLSNIIVVLKNLFNQETQIYKNRNEFFKRLNDLDFKRRMDNINNNKIMKINYEYNNIDDNFDIQ